MYNYFCHFVLFVLGSGKSNLNNEIRSNSKKQIDNQLWIISLENLYFIKRDDDCFYTLKPDK